MSLRRGLDKIEASFLDIHSRLTFTTWTRTDAQEYDNQLINNNSLLGLPAN